MSLYIPEKNGIFMQSDLISSRLNVQSGSTQKMLSTKTNLHPAAARVKDLTAKTFPLLTYLRFTKHHDCSLVCFYGFPDVFLDSYHSTVLHHLLQL